MECKPEELHFLRPLALCLEAARIPRAQWQLLCRVAAAFVLPLSALFLAHICISHALFSHFDPNDYSDYRRSRPSSAGLVADWVNYILFNSVSLVALLYLSHPSTAVAVFSVASAYSGKDGLSSPHVLAALPEVWRRVVAASPAAFLLLVWYVAFVLAASLLCLLVGARGSLLLLLLAAYFPGVVLLVGAAVVWSLASAASVLGGSKGLDVLLNSRSVTAGQLWTAAAMLVALNACSVGVAEAFTEAVVRRRRLRPETGGRLVFGMVILVVLCTVRLFSLVVLFVSKSSRHESVEKSNGCDQPQDHQGEPEPLMAADAQTEQCPV